MHGNALFKTKSGPIVLMVWMFCACGFLLFVCSSAALRTLSRKTGRRPAPAGIQEVRKPEGAHGKRKLGLKTPRAAWKVLFAGELGV